jgi:hypothetical protein
MFKTFLINLLFKLLGNSNTRLYNIQYLFGASTFNHTGRRAKWEKALFRLYKDKDLLDYLYYHAESDKEAVFRNSSTSDLSKGARLRTLFIIYSARRAYLEQRKRKVNKAEDISNINTEIKNIDVGYKKIVNIIK